VLGLSGAATVAGGEQAPAPGQDVGQPGAPVVGEQRLLLEVPDRLAEPVQVLQPGGEGARCRASAQLRGDVGHRATSVVVRSVEDVVLGVSAEDSASTASYTCSVAATTRSQS
jgi:hypothetical protein